MKKYWYKYQFEKLLKFESNKYLVWESEELNDLAFWELDTITKHVI